MRIFNLVARSSALTLVALVVAAQFAGTAGATEVKFGSPDYIQQWNRKFESKQRLLNGAVSVLPKHGFAPHPVVPAQGSGDYFHEEMSRGAMRWGHMPLRVCIVGGGAGFRPEYANIFANCLDEWSKNGGGKISFVRVQSAQESDISVSWLPGSPFAGESGNTRSSFTQGYGERLLTHAHIDIAGIINGRPMPDDEMRKTCLHELGHALGMVHTSNPADIMYFQSNGQQTCALKPRDANTIQRLYSSLN